jgi:tetratricopeptide (TPR) repeat protein
LLAAALVWACTGIAVAATDAEVVAQAEGLFKAGRYAEVYQLLEPLEDRLAGDVKFDYLLARSALETGQPSKASFIYERILAVDPDYLGVRLEMGRAYLALRDYARAKLEFETVLRFDNLPPDLRQQALAYGKAADDLIAGKRTALHAYAEYGFGYDSNAISATSVREIISVSGLLVILPDDARERSDHYNAISVGGEVIHALGERFSLFAGADGRTRAYRNVEAGDLGSIDVRLGIGYNDGPSSARLGLTAGRFWLNHEKTRDSLGLTADYRRLIGRQDQLSVTLLATRFAFLPEVLQTADYDLYQLGVGWLHASADGRTAIGATLLGGVERETSGRDDGDKPFFGARLTLQHALTDSVGAFVVGGALRGDYSRENAFFGITREDTLADAVAGVSWTFAKGWSLRPQIFYVKNESNIPLFEYDRTEVSINLRKDL